MHTTEIGGTVFIHNGDYSGEPSRSVLIAAPRLTRSPRFARGVRGR